jgi:predicted TIM-barrel fold metal-dependent hydrolase
MVDFSRIIDCYVNANPDEYASKQFAGVQKLFANQKERDGSSAAQMVAKMDELGIERALLSSGPGMPEDEGRRWVLEAIQRYPERFAFAARANPHEGMAAVRKLESEVRNDGAVALRLVPIRFKAPANDKIYFPLYTKCCELNVPVTITTGIPGPLVPGEIQRPIYLDELCYLMPELTIVSTHGGEPWTDELVKLMFKWPNLYHMISAFNPKWYPRALIDFMNTRGADKVMFATDYPLISWDRAIPQLKNVPLKDEVWPKFLRENALRVFRWSGSGS